MSIIGVLQEFYKSINKGSICTGIQIETDNNGHWSVCIDLFDTVYENKNFENIFIKNSEDNWFKCIKENSLFKGYGGMENLEDILDIFYYWIKADKMLNMQKLNQVIN